MKATFPLKAILLICFITLFSCQTPRARNKPTIYPIARTFYNVDYNAVWEATLSALADFELIKTIKDQGLLVTDWKSGAHSKYFTRYDREIIYKKGKYRISAFVRTLETGVNVKIIKEHQIEMDTLEGWQPVPTDGIIEKSILYRVGHLIAIEKFLTDPPENDNKSKKRKRRKRRKRKHRS